MIPAYVELSRFRMARYDGGSAELMRTERFAGVRMVKDRACSISLSASTRLDASARPS